MGIAHAQLRNILEFNEHPRLRERNRGPDVETSQRHIVQAVSPALGKHAESVLEDFGLRPEATAEA